jgi:hypothetical protein
MRGPLEELSELPVQRDVLWVLNVIDQHEDGGLVRQTAPDLIDAEPFYRVEGQARDSGVRQGRFQLRRKTAADLSAPHVDPHHDLA